MYGSGNIPRIPLAKHAALVPVVVMASLLMTAPLGATEPERLYDRVQYEVGAMEEVAQDILVAQLAAQMQSASAAEAADEVNRRVEWALAEAKAVTGVKTRTAGYRTDPVHRKEQPVAWRVEQGLTLESSEPAKLSALLGRLQERLSLRSIDYRVSPARRAEAEERLIAQALAAFRARGERISRELGRAGYRIVQMDVQTGSAVVPMPRAMRAMAVEADVAAPALEAGTQTVTVNVSGTIELGNP